MTFSLKHAIRTLCFFASLCTMGTLSAYAAEKTDSYCVTVGMNGDNSPFYEEMFSYTSHDLGQSWDTPTQHSSDIPYFDLTDVSCNPQGTCIAAGSETGWLPLAYISNDQGKTWTPHLLPLNDNSAFYVQDVTCTKNSCVVVGHSTDPYTWRPYVFTTYDQGQYWHVTGLPTVNGLGDVPHNMSCDDNGLCMVVGEYRTNNSGVYRPLVYISLDAGRTWNINRQLSDMGINGTLRLVDCQNGQCLAVGQLSSSYDYATTVYTFKLENAQWTINDIASPLGIYGIDCDPTQQFCVIVGAKKYNGGAESYFTEDGGKTWAQTIHAFPIEGGSYFNLIDVSCDTNPDNSYCVALGSYAYTPVGSSDYYFSGIFYTSYDWGKTWEPAVFPTAISPPISQVFQGVSCQRI